MSNGHALEWAQVDVFADTPYAGNMLAIFPDATGLSDEQMQALARETNLSETTFVLPRNAATEQAQGVRVRIFTIEEELPFAGHPTLGTASWLRQNRSALLGAERVTLHLNVGPVEVRFPDEIAPAHGVIAEMVQPNPRFFAPVLRDAVAAVLGLNAAGMHPTLEPQVVSTGLPFLIAPLASVEALAAIRPDLSALRTLVADSSAKFVYCIAPANEATWHARMPFYGGEDPATGSAAGCAISYLVEHRAVQPDFPITILQGQHVHRPSRIGVRAGVLSQSGEQRVTDVRVRGCTIHVATGRFFRP